MRTFRLEEATIAQIHSAYRTGELTAEALVGMYLERIEAYDKKGPAINAIAYVNPHAVEQAKDLDREFARSRRFIGPLHGIPILVKDQVETQGIPTSFGSRVFKDFVPERDAFAVKRLRDAGAIVLAKAANAEFGVSFWSYSSLTDKTRNPYALGCDSGGSSGGSGAGAAANFATVAVGEDTGGSIRIPGSHCCLAGVRVTPGLISRSGASSLLSYQDTLGPMARTVWDAAAVLDVMVGFDPSDDFTAAYAIARPPASYTESLSPDGLMGARVGLVLNALGSSDDPLCAAVNEVVDAAVSAIRGAGAEVLEIEIPDLESRLQATYLYARSSKADINAFLAQRPNAPVHTIEEIYRTRQYHPMHDLMEIIVAGPDNVDDDPEYNRRLAERQVFTRAVVGILAKERLDALVFPDVQVPAPQHEMLESHKWTTLTYPTNTGIASNTGMPAMTVPAGFTPDGLPVGLEFLARPYDEPAMLRLGYAFEQATKHRRPPESTPELARVD